MPLSSEFEKSRSSHTSPIGKGAFRQHPGHDSETRQAGFMALFCLLTFFAIIGVRVHWILTVMLLIPAAWSFCRTALVRSIKEIAEPVHGTPDDRTNDRCEPSPYKH